MKAAGKALEIIRPTIFWTPCAAHCVNLMLEDMGNLDFNKGVSGNVNQSWLFNFNKGVSGNLDFTFFSSMLTERRILNKQYQWVVDLSI